MPRYRVELRMACEGPANSVKLLNPGITPSGDMCIVIGGEGLAFDSTVEIHVKELDNESLPVSGGVCMKHSVKCEGCRKTIDRRCGYITNSGLLVCTKCYGEESQSKKPKEIE